MAKVVALNLLLLQLMLPVLLKVLVQVLLVLCWRQVCRSQLVGLSMARRCPWHVLLLELSLLSLRHHASCSYRRLVVLLAPFQGQSLLSSMVHR